MSFFNRIMPSASNAHFFAVITLAGFFIWLGLLGLAGTTEKAVFNWINGHQFTATLKPHNDTIAILIAIAQTAAGFLIAIFAVPQRFKRLSYVFIIVFGCGALSLLVTNDVWIKSLGGFPAIGAGQGLIKYVAIIGVAMWFLGMRGAKEVMLMGLLIVLGWIGAMKFTGPEAEGVWPLLTSSPVFSWWLTDFGKQMASNIIGAIELLTVILLTAYWWNRRAFEIGLFLSAATFIVTISFLITFGPSWDGSFPYLSSTGIFLIKDAVLLAAVFILYRD